MRTTLVVAVVATLAANSTVRVNKHTALDYYALDSLYQGDHNTGIQTYHLKMSWFKRWTDTDSEVDVQSVFSDLSKGSIAKQLTVGVLTGLCSGFVFSHVGKAAAMGVGGGLLILQVSESFANIPTELPCLGDLENLGQLPVQEVFKIAESLGWISINWGKVNNTVEKAKERLAKSDKDKAILKIKVFVRDNIFIVGGFVSGFFIGIAI